MEDTATSRRTAAGANAPSRSDALKPTEAAAAGAGKADAGTAKSAKGDDSAPFRFSEAALVAAGVRDAAFLPAIVAGDVLSGEHGSPWPVRRCRFGPPLEALNPGHSDLLLLKYAS